MKINTSTFDVYGRWENDMFSVWFKQVIMNPGVIEVMIVNVEVESWTIWPTLFSFSLILLYFRPFWTILLLWVCLKFSKYLFQNKHWLIQQTIVPLPNNSISDLDDKFRNRQVQNIMVINKVCVSYLYYLCVCMYVCVCECVYVPVVFCYSFYLCSVGVSVSYVIMFNNT